MVMSVSEESGVADVYLSGKDESPYKLWYFDPVDENCDEKVTATVGYGDTHSSETYTPYERRVLEERRELRESHAINKRRSLLRNSPIRRPVRKTEPDSDDGRDSHTMNPLARYAHCADEGEICKYEGTVNVAYGAGGKFTYKTYLAKGQIACDSSRFRDPIPGVKKSCYVKKVDSGLYYWRRTGYRLWR
jgi:hypothetical protein